MAPPSDAELIAVIAGFVQRARRVVAHSLLQDEGGLDALAAGAFFAEQKDGAVSLKRILPNEEILESLAARVRPLTLQQDPVHYDKVLNALQSLLHSNGNTDYIEWCKSLKSEWHSVNVSSGKATYFVSLTKADEDDPSVPQEMTDAALALAWFYGDLVHADADHIEAGNKFGIDLRFAAAAVRTAQLASLARDTLSFLRFLADENVIDLDFEQLDLVEVAVTSKEQTLSSVYLGLAADSEIEHGKPIDMSKLQEVTGAWLSKENGTFQMRIPWGRDAD